MGININEVFPSKWLKAADVMAEPDKTLTLTIDRVEIQEIGQDRDRKAVALFTDHEKGLVLNKTNFETISLFYGPDTDGWVNGQIKLYATPVAFGGKTDWGIRVTDPNAPAPAAPRGAPKPPAPARAASNGAPRRPGQAVGPNLGQAVAAVREAATVGAEDDGDDPFSDE